MTLEMFQSVVNLKFKLSKTYYQWTRLFESRLTITKD